MNTGKRFVRNVVSILKEHLNLNVSIILKGMRIPVMATKNEQTGRIGEKLVELELLKRDINFWEMAGENPYFDLIIDTKRGIKKGSDKNSKQK